MLDGEVGHGSEIAAVSRELFRCAMGLGGGAPARDRAVTVMVAARCLERVSDNAVELAEQAGLSAASAFRELADAPPVFIDGWPM